MIKKNVTKGVVGGLALGAVNGLFGAGAGMVAVPLLYGGFGYTQRQAHATAILIVAPLCAVSAAFYILFGYAEAEVVVPAALGNVAGGLLGAKFLGKLPAVWTDVIFIALMLAAGIRMAVG